MHSNVDKIRIIVERETMENVERIGKRRKSSQQKIIFASKKSAEKENSLKALNIQKFI